ncbi:Uma2 family endonuclease [Muricoccus radiodurans]|uniref:Uma2 family endonuclease n=1 Tax=Muricoccus radiodurans TaxID=2231721 RepID=UPI003CEA03AB
MSAALDMTPPDTLESFLGWERFQDLRYEWDGVQPVAMTDGTLRHARLANRVYDALTAPLRGSPCEVFRSDMRVMTARGTRVRYPDLVVSRTPLRGDERDLPDPVLIVEVMSGSTTAMDRGIKRAEYADHLSLRRDVMLVQDEPLALVCARDDGFAERRVRDALDLPEFGLSIPLAALHDGLNRE